MRAAKISPKSTEFCVISQLNIWVTVDFGRYEGLWTAFGPGPGPPEWYSSGGPAPWGVHNLHCALSLGYYCKTRDVRGSDYSPTTTLSEEKDKLVSEKVHQLELHLSHLMTKSIKWHVHPAKTQISLGRCMKKTWVYSYPLSAQRRLWSDWADAQADPSLCWLHCHRDFNAYIFGSHKRTRSQCKKVYIFSILWKKFPIWEENFPNRSNCLHEYCWIIKTMSFVNSSCSNNRYIC